MSFTDPFTTTYGTVSITTQETPNSFGPIPPNTFGYGSLFVGSGDPNLDNATGTQYGFSYYYINVSVTSNGQTTPIPLPYIVGDYYSEDTNSILLITYPLQPSLGFSWEGGFNEQVTYYKNNNSFYLFNVATGNLTELGTASNVFPMENGTVYSTFYDTQDPVTGAFKFNGIELLTYTSPYPYTEIYDQATLRDLYYDNSSTLTQISFASASSLFTSGADNVNFNSLTTAQQTAVNSGADLYDALGGGDTITLPNANPTDTSVTLTNTSKTFDLTHAFDLGDNAGDTTSVTGGNGSYNIALGAGTDTVTINGNGNSNITAGSGSDTISITGNGNNTVTIGTGNDAVTISGTGNNTVIDGGASGVTISQFQGALDGTDPTNSDTLDITKPSSGKMTIGSQGVGTLDALFNGSVTFSGIGGTLKIDPSVDPNKNFVINGFAKGDIVDFTNQPGLTLEGALYSDTTGEVDIYNKATPVASFIFSGLSTTTLEPLSDGKGGTEIVVDPTNVQLSDPQPPGESAGVSIHWDIIHKNEGGDWLNPYVPPGSLSGLTVGYGIDLANGIDQAEFSNILNNLGDDPNLVKDNPNLSYLYLATKLGAGVVGTAAPQGAGALAYLKPPNGLEDTIKVNGIPDPASISVSITQSQANALTQQVEEDHLFGTATAPQTGLLSQWGSSVDFTTLPWQAQTALMDIDFNYGHVTGLGLLNDARTAAATITPADPTGDPAAWFTLATDISHLRANNSRMVSDALLVMQIAPGNTLTPPIDEPGTAVAANAVAYNFSVADTTTQYAIDPAGSTTYSLIENPGSPNFASLTLPTDGADLYSVSYQIGTNWSAPQIAMPDQTLTLPSDVTGVRVDLEDSNGNPIPDPGSFVFFVTFAGSGTFSGTVYDLTSTANTPLVATPSSLSGTEGASINATVATFTDANPNAAAGDFTATINWGDGTTTTGTVVAQNGGGFAVTGAHTYAEEGNFQVGVTINDVGGSTASATSTAAIADAPLTATASNISGTEGTAVNATVATFTDANPGAAASDFTATINWGDGTTTTGTVVAQNNGGFAVTGAHTYAVEGNFQVGVTINDVGGSTASTTSTAAIADAPLTASASSITGTEGASINATVVTFTDANPGAAASDFSATINWGDGTSTTGTVVAENGGGFAVTGAHTYAGEGNFQVGVTINDVGGSTASTTSTAAIAMLAGPPVIDPLHTIATGTIDELPHATGSHAIDSVGGTIAFADADLTDRPTATIDTQDETVTYQDASGHTYALTLAQIAAFEGAIQITPEKGNTNTGKIDWSFSMTDSHFDFLGVGEHLTVTVPILIDDHNGGKVTQDVVVTIDGSNDNPIAVPDSNGVAKGKSISESAAHGVLANDSDPDIHDQLTVEAVNGRSSAVGHSIEGKYGLLILNADGSYTYHADRDANGFDDDDGGVAQDVFKYTVSDGHGGLSTSTLSFVVFDRGTTYLSGADTTLTAGNGQYVLDGSAGGDTLKAGNGNDVLIGGNGDALVAGHGQDNFLFRPNFGTNTISNFNIHDDTLQFDHSIFSNLHDILAHTTDTAAGAMISDGHGDTVTLLGIKAAQLHLHQDDFHLV